LVELRIGSVGQFEQVPDVYVFSGERKAISVAGGRDDFWAKRFAKTRHPHA